jgi:alpha-glucan,water dikinase
VSNSEKIATRHGDVEVEKKVRGELLEITLDFHTNQECLFHWGLSRFPNGPWQLPSEELRPEKTRAHDDHAAQTPIGPGGVIHIKIACEEYAELPFVLYFPRINEWDSNHGKNYRILLSDTSLEAKGSREITDEEFQNVAAEIIQKETSGNSWTLMHRYNLCHELLDRVGQSKEGLALLFIWLRFSALRQLDWQRNYNTQPRELSHAQQRLTARLTQLYKEEPGQRELVRLMLTTMGHGGEGQRIRDEILEIMHRYGIKEVSDIFMEQWHQKMHNNTTPDDIVVCEAYLAFLRSEGSFDIFYRTLEEGGVTRGRLESFERPILAKPDYNPDQKDAMIPDFEHFLGTLKSVHSATDLGICIQAARAHFDDDMHESADFIWGHRDTRGPEAILLLQRVTQMRRRVLSRLESGGGQPELLCLDVSLEDFVRILSERSIQAESGEGFLSEWLALIMDNFLMVHEEPDLSFSLLQWNHIRESGIPDPNRTLEADAVLDRIERSGGDYADRFQNLLQPRAESLGKSFQADPWAIRLFSEEVMRGGLVFSISVLSYHLRRLLRKRAKLPSWQPVSRGGGKGIVRVMKSLDPVQGRRFEPPVIIVSDSIRGNEDIPEGVVAVLTSGSVDVVSHMAIRARNQGVLLATCYEPEIFENLRAREGLFMDVRVDASGDVRFEPADESGEHAVTGGKADQFVGMNSAGLSDAPYALTAEKFEKGLVGGKSLHLKQLEGRLPGWIYLPASAALSFRSFEMVLGTEANRATRKHYEQLLTRVNEEPDVVPELRKNVMELVEPEDLQAVLREAMKKAGLPLPLNTEKAWECIKRVWASKWNERAYWNRRASGIPHDSLLMAVLIQEMVPAEYAYIIHTVHPFSGDEGEVYIEVVLGLGETLAGNYPGRALSCTWHKGSEDLRVIGFPSKSIGLYGRGMIFRSDSNAEDLPGYAGAGLYGSFPLQPLEEIHLNYTDEPLLRDKTFCSEFLARVGRIGLLIEKAMGSPQDIEGVFKDGRYYVVQTRPQVGLEV